MANRYEIIFKSEESLYSDYAPVVITANALTKDNDENTVLLQLKMKNVSEKIIKAVEVKIYPMNTLGESLGLPVDYQYLDLNAGFNEDFGGKTGITIPDKKTRKFDVCVTKVIFSDETVWNGEESPWKPVPKVKLLEESLGDILAAQYKRDIGATAKYEPFAYKGIWVCTCGSINGNHINKCRICKTDFHMQYTNLDRGTLAKNKAIFDEEEEARIKKEKEELEAKLKEEREAEREATKLEAQRIEKAFNIFLFGVAIVIFYLFYLWDTGLI